MTNNNQPTILVKKSDGTFVRMTLEEIKKAKSGVSLPPSPRGATGPLRRSFSEARGLPSSAANTPSPAPQKTHEHHQHPSHPHPHANQQHHHASHSTQHVAHEHHKHHQPTLASLTLRRSGPTPLKQGIVTQPASVKEFSAPLEEAPKSIDAKTVVSQPRLDEADKVIKRLSFNIPPNFLNRLRSLIQLYLKDVRSAEQTKEVAKRPLNEGGLALKPEQAEEIIKMGDEWKKTEKIDEVKLVKNVTENTKGLPYKSPSAREGAAPKWPGGVGASATPPRPLLERGGSQPTPGLEASPAPFEGLRTPQGLERQAGNTSGSLGMTKNQPVAVTQPKPAAVEPFKMESRIEPKIELAEKPMPINLTPSVKVNMTREKDNMAAREVQEGKNPGTVEDFLGEKIHTAPVEKKASPLVRDVISEAEEMGPVDEIKKFSLTDFRRLSSNPDEAADRLKQKFINLRDESYLLFLEALKAWRRSPLFVESLRAVEKALATRQKLSVILLDKNKIQWAEIKALLGMEKELVF